MRIIDADALIESIKRQCGICKLLPNEEIRQLAVIMEMGLIEEVNNAPTVEPNLILPEQMGRGDIYEVGETIVVMNHDDYYDLLCKSWMPKRGEWIDYSCGSGCYCSNCEWDGDDTIDECIIRDFIFCPNCGAEMRDRKEKCKECWYWSEVHKRCENKSGCQFKPYGEREGE